jgi:Rrf2 family protein
MEAIILHITLETDYALRIVDCLARHSQNAKLLNAARIARGPEEDEVEITGRMGAKPLSDEARVTLRFSLKILRKLVSAGIVRSYKGTRGGYEIARSLEDISLHDVMETIEGSFLLNRCLCSSFECSQHEDKNCAYYNVFAEISNDVQRKLKSITLAQLLRGQENGDELDDDLEYEWEPEYTMQH